MIHLCTIATLMFLQNNTSQKILFIAARTIQFPGVVFKVCIYLIVAIVTSSLYFDVKSTHTLSKIYISNHYYSHHHQHQIIMLKGGQNIGMTDSGGHEPSLLNTCDFHACNYLCKRDPYYTYNSQISSKKIEKHKEGK